MIAFDSGISTTSIEASLASTDLFPRKDDWHGGTRVHPGNAVTLFGNVTNLFHVQDAKYLVTEYSRIQFTHTRASDRQPKFIGFCLISIYDRGADQCVNFANIFAAYQKGQTSTLMASPTPLTMLYNLALGKRATHSPFLEENLNLPNEPSKAVDGNNATSYEIGGESRTIDSSEDVKSYLKNKGGYQTGVDLYDGIEYELWWEVDLEKEYLIQELIVHCDDLRSLYQIVIFDAKGEVAFDLNNITEASIEVPFIRGVRVRILFQRDSVLSVDSTPLIPDYDVPSSVSLHHVMVVEASIEPVQVDIPIGRLRLGNPTGDPNDYDDVNQNDRDHSNDYRNEYGSFDHIGFVQSATHASTTSRISDIKLLYLSAEEFN